MSDDISDKGRLLFGAGFAFGVLFTMVVLALVTVTVVGRSGEGIFLWDIVATIAGGALFTGIVGVSLYVLAFPENRVAVPVQSLFDSGDDEAE